MTLEISQVVILLSGAIPIILLMKKYEIDSVTKMFFTIAYLAYPAINYGSIYDFHENCFILPLLLWMFFFYEKGKNIPFFIFAFLVLTVKEEAFAYVFIFAVYILVSRKDRKKGVALMVVSAVYFGLAVLYISRFGEGIMSNRFANLKLPNEGLSRARRIIEADCAESGMKVKLICVSRNVPEVTMSYDPASGSWSTTRKLDDSWDIVRIEPKRASSLGKVDLVLYPQVSIMNLIINQVYQTLWQISPAVEV